MRLPRARPAAIGALIAAVWLAPVVATAGPDIEQWRTDNGARVLFVRAPEISLVDARVTFAAGSARDRKHPGIARLTSNLLMAGTSERDADAVARRLERHGANVSTGSKRDMAWIELRSLAEAQHLAPVAETVGSILARPEFPRDAIDRRKSQQRTALEEQAQSPGAIARNRLWSALYAGHPYGHDPLGTRESLAAIERSDLRAFHERYYAAANATVAIVGAIPRARAQRLAQTLVSKLPAGDPASPVPAAPTLDASRTIRESFPSTQAHVLVGQTGVERGYARWPALYVANHIFGGGGFTSRLFSRVREDKGLAYSVYSYASPMAAQGPFVIGLQTRGDRTQQALSIVREQLGMFLEDGPTASEVADAQRQIRGSFPLKIDSNGELSSYLSMIGFYDLPLDYLDRFPRQVGAVTSERAHSAFRAAVGDNPRVTVIVGGDRTSGDEQAE